MRPGGERARVHCWYPTTTLGPLDFLLSHASSVPRSSRVRQGASPQFRRVHLLPRPRLSHERQRNQRKGEREEQKRNERNGSG